jgi:hypothetical protein
MPCSSYVVFDSLTFPGHCHRIVPSDENEKKHQEQAMPTDINEICRKAAELPDLEKLVLVDALLTQLDRPDPEVDRIWTEEARRRRQAYREGRLEARDYEQITEGFPRP